MIKEITFLNSRNEKIEGILKEKGTSGPLFIVCHGFNSSKDHPALVSISNKLYERGYSTFTFNFSSSAQGFNLAEQISDINDVIHHFKNYKLPIMLSGSFGALSGVIAATQLSKIKGLVFVNGFFGAGQLKWKILKIYLLFRISTLFRSSYKRVWRFYKDNYRPEEININTLVIHARNDEEVSLSQSKVFFERAGGKKELYILEKGDHHLTRDSYREEIVVAIDNWLKRVNF